MESLRQVKVQKFEELVDQRLKPDLVRAIAERDKVFKQPKIISDLRRNNENLEKNSVTSLSTFVDIALRRTCKRKCLITAHICGYRTRNVEFTWSEALNHITQKKESSKIEISVSSSNLRPNSHSARQIEEFTQLIASIKLRSNWFVKGSEIYFNFQRRNLYQNVN